MKVENLNPKIIHGVVSLFKSYKDKKADTPSEFLEENMSSYISKKDEGGGEDTLAAFSELFLQVVKHEKFLERFILQYYKKIRRIIHTDKYLLMVLCFVIISFTKKEQLNAVGEILAATSVHKAIVLASFLSHESGVLLLTQAASYFFDQDYVKDVIIGEVLKDSCIFQKLHSILTNVRVEPTKRNFTKPQHVNVLSYIKKVPRPPCNTANDESSGYVKAHDVPISTYKKPTMDKKLREKHKKNKQKSANLFREAQMMPSNLTQPLRSKQPETQIAEVPTIPLIKAKPLPNFKEPEVPVKMNTSSVLRQGIKIVKEEEEEIKRVKNLTVGALDYTQFEKLFIELRNKEEQEYLQSIEKKHLKGLSTYEEAILAKMNYLQKNKEKRVHYEEQRKELEEQLKEFRQIEEEKIKQIIQKTQEIQKNVDEKKRNLLNKKQMKAKEISEESRTLMLEVLKKRTEELNRKIELIKEIRTLKSFTIRRKEFDETETMNIGLLCEMSIAELNERLAMVRAEMKDELEMRRSRIKKEKVRQQELLKEMQKLIESNQVERKRISVSKTKGTITFEPDEEIIALRKKLEAAREKRKAAIVG